MSEYWKGVRDVIVLLLFLLLMFTATYSPQEVGEALLRPYGDTPTLSPQDAIRGRSQ